jgi:hypothetical protein
MTERPTKITFAKMREMGVRGSPIWLPQCLVFLIQIFMAALIVFFFSSTITRAAQATVKRHLGERYLSVAAHGMAADDIAEGGNIASTYFPGCGKERCVIKYDGGGIPLMYEVAKIELIQKGVRQIVIDGRCISTCALVLDWIRFEGVDVCMTATGILGFHKGTKYRRINVRTTSDGKEDYDLVPKSYFDPQQTPKVMRWVRSHGGFPLADDFENMLHLTLENSRGIFRACTANDIR